MKGITQIEVIVILLAVVVSTVVILVLFMNMQNNAISPNAGKSCITADNQAGVYATDGVTCIPSGQSAEKKYYTCLDGTKVLWCDVNAGGQYTCVPNPETQCNAKSCSSNPSSWGNCFNNAGCYVACWANPPWAQNTLGCVC